ncbi:MAG TPA: ribosome recycling factor [Thermoanaerobaculia bacterium]|nr:ribosome recycling factor [Thermoanaerobaculia bacterium]HQR65952.1 ribosome recycling factor [Thermoanaerobaculia bacterium]
MPLTEIKKEAERRMTTSLEAFRTELKHLRTGRATTALLDGILVEYYGTPTPLNQVATLMAPDATLLVAQPYEPSLCPVIEKAIRKSDLGLNPASDGKVVRIPVPPPTEERRKEIAKKAHTLAEQARVEIRHHRHEANEKVKKEAKASAVPADDEKRALDEVQKLTDRSIAEVDTVLKAKESEILAR